MTSSISWGSIQSQDPLRLYEHLHLSRLSIRRQDPRFSLLRRRPESLCRPRVSSGLSSTSALSDRPPPMERWRSLASHSCGHHLQHHHSPLAHLSVHNLFQHILSLSRSLRVNSASIWQCVLHGCRSSIGSLTYTHNITNEGGKHWRRIFHWAIWSAFSRG